MRTSRRLSVLLAGATAALLVGCSDGGGDTSAAPSPSSEPPAPAAVVRSAAMQTDGMMSSRYVLTTSTEQDDAEVVFMGKGIYDWSTDTGQTTYDVPVGTVQQRLVGPDLYLSLPQQPDAFFKLLVADVAATPLGGTVDPSAQLHMLAAVADAELVGEEEVRGVQTTHYRGSYDVGRALRGARGLQQTALRSSLGAAADVTEATYDVFLDDAGRLRKLTQTVEVPATAERGGTPATVTTTLELWDFGITVEVMAPPGDKVRDGSPLLAALRQVMSTPVEVPKPAASAVPSPPAAPSVLPSPPAVTG
jgi:hypothetical protein